MRTLYASATCVVMHADVFELAGALLVGESRVDVTLTDPPYTDHVHANIRSCTTNGQLKVKSWKPGFSALTNFDHVGALLAITRRWVVCFCALESFGDYRTAAGGDWSSKAKGSYVRSGIWRKKQAAPQISGDRPANSCEGYAVMHPRVAVGERLRWNGRGRHAYTTHADDLDVTLHADPDVGMVSGPVSFVEHGRERAEKRHPSQKPDALMREMVELYSEPGEVMFDPYCGSGATGAAALGLGRSVVLADADLKWATFTAERMAALEAELQRGAA